LHLTFVDWAAIVGYLIHRHWPEIDWILHILTG